MATKIAIIDAKNNYDVSKLNAVQHGILSRHAILPWEEKSEYEALATSLMEEYKPQGITEGHLVEELACIIWRKRRLRIGEAAHYRRILRHDDDYNNSTALAAMVYVDTDVDVGKFSTKKALAASDAANKKELKVIAGYREPAIKALAMLENDASYEDTLAVLAEGTREWWLEDVLHQENMSGELINKPNVECLHKFLTEDALPQYNQEYEEVRYRELVRQQAEGEAFIPGDRLEKFARYEVHLDRKFERTLSMLVKLQDIRRPTEPPPAH